MVDTKVSALPAATLPLTGTELVPVVQDGVSRRVARADLVGIDVVRTLTTTQAVTATTGVAITGLATTLGVGSYLVKFWVCYRAAAATTGIQMHMRHGGTTTRCVATWYTLTTGGAATTGVADQATTATAQMMEGKGQRASDVASGPTQGVDTLNADQFAVMEGIVIVTASGTLDLMVASEVSGSAVTMMEGSSVTITKVA